MRYDGEQPCNGGYISRVTSPNSEQVLGQGSNIVMDMQKNPSNCLETSLNNVVNKDSSFEAVVKDKQTAFTTFGADIGESQNFSSDGVKAMLVSDNISRDGGSVACLDLTVPPAGNILYFKAFQFWI